MRAVVRNKRDDKDCTDDLILHWSGPQLKHFALHTWNQSQRQKKKSGNVSINDRSASYTSGSSMKSQRPIWGCQAGAATKRFTLLALLEIQPILEFFSLSTGSYDYPCPKKKKGLSADNRDLHMLCETVQSFTAVLLELSAPLQPRPACNLLL